MSGFLPESNLKFPENLEAAKTFSSMGNYWLALRCLEVCHEHLRDGGGLSRGGYTFGVRAQVELEEAYCYQRLGFVEKAARSQQRGDSNLIRGYVARDGVNVEELCVSNRNLVAMLVRLGQQQDARKYISETRAVYKGLLGDRAGDPVVILMVALAEATATICQSEDRDEHALRWLSLAETGYEAIPQDSPWRECVRYRLLGLLNEKKRISEKLGHERELSLIRGKMKARLI